MNTLFADTSYYLALLNADDQYNAQAAQLTSPLRGRTATHAWILTEVADALRRPGYRDEAARFIADLRKDPRVIVVPASEELFEQGLELYAQRADEEWSLTDCISFVVMRDQGIQEALSADHHFQQAGFVILMK
jgi:predicted nucleic acid-binding protein